jgi:hypothetical protein
MATLPPVDMYAVYMTRLMLKTAFTQTKSEDDTTSSSSKDSMIMAPRAPTNALSLLTLMARTQHTSHPQLANALRSHPANVVSEMIASLPWPKDIEHDENAGSFARMRCQNFPEDFDVDSDEMVIPHIPPRLRMRHSLIRTFNHSSR